MPPKVKITRDEIIKASIELTRREGSEAVNARSIANILGCSTQPIFSNFTTMDELNEAITLAAYNCYTSFIESELKSEKYPPYKAFGMAYVRFAKEEKELFKLLYMCDRTGKSFVPTNDFDSSVEMIMQANGISREKAALLHLEMWTYVHGIGAMLATSFLELDFELISNMITDVYQGLRTRLTLEE